MVKIVQLFVVLGCLNKMEGAINATLIVYSANNRHLVLFVIKIRSTLMVCAWINVHQDFN